jgi:hypothetical protein
MCTCVSVCVGHIHLRLQFRPRKAGTTRGCPGAGGAGHVAAQHEPGAGDAYEAEGATEADAAD